MAREFLWTRRVAFGDCDPAQIAYTGRLVDYALEALEAFWDDLLEGGGWYEMAVVTGQGMPFVRLEFEFLSPVTPRQPVVLRVTPEAVGRSSVTMQVEARHGAALAFRARFVSVFVSRESGMSPVRIPDDVRAKLATFDGGSGG